jgi:4-hydroxy-tetrahydrodipicolinate reductase
LRRKALDYDDDDKDFDNDCERQRGGKPMNRIDVMVNGLPGNMARTIVARAQQDDRFNLVPFSLTGPEISDAACRVGAAEFRLLHPDVRDEEIKKVMASRASFISVDFTLPTAVNANAHFYCSHGLPFVMGTTGGDRRELEKTVSSVEIAAVIAPNMAKQIVGFQAMMAYGADHFPGLFDGYRLDIRESHQKGKADTSGTAKAMVGYFNRLGIPFSADQIRKERDPQIQLTEWKIPETFLNGHGWHTYRLVSEDGTVCFEFTHNVNGREIYALGALDAVAFLAEKIAAGVRGRLYSMIDVLEGEL